MTDRDSSAHSPSPPTPGSSIRETSPLLPSPPKPASNTGTGFFGSIKRGFLFLHRSGLIWHVFFLTVLTTLSVLVVRAVYLRRNPLALLMLVGYAAIFYAIYGGVSRDMIQRRRREGEDGEEGGGGDA